MAKTHLEVLSETFLENTKMIEEQSFKFNDFLDSVIVWVVGLSTGGIVLVIANNDKLSFMDKSSVVFVMYCLLYSIICGVVGRVLYTIAMRAGLTLYATFMAALGQAKLLSELDAVPSSNSEENEELVNKAVDKIQGITIKSWGFPDDYFAKKKGSDNRFNGIINRSFSYASYLFYLASVTEFIYALSYLISQYSKFK